MNEQQKEPSFLDKLKMSPSQLWENHKLFICTFGVLLLAIKFQDVIFDLLVGSSKKLVKDAEKKSDALKQEENQANGKANQLVQEAKQLGENRSEVDENWHKK